MFVCLRACLLVFLCVCILVCVCRSADERLTSDVGYSVNRFMCKDGFTNRSSAAACSWKVRVLLHWFLFLASVFVRSLVRLLACLFVSSVCFIVCVCVVIFRSFRDRFVGYTLGQRAVVACTFARFLDKPAFV